MGLLTVIVIRHDALGQIEERPKEFVHNLSQAIAEGVEGYTEIPCGNHANVAVVMESRHSSDAQAYILAGNTIAPISSETTQPEHWASKHIINALERAHIPLE